MSDTKNPNSPAFPTVAGNVVYSSGMSLRDWFAGQVIGAIHSGATDDVFDRAGWQHVIAEEAYMIADAMLAARGKP